MSDAEKGAGTLSGLNEREAKEFHNLFISGFLFFVFVAIVAHFLVWQWRPWLPGTSGYVTAMVDQAKLVAAYIPHVLA